jgi:hypothetical protein
MPEIDSVVPARMEKAPDGVSLGVKTAQGPAGKTDNRPVPRPLFQEAGTIVTKFPSKAPNIVQVVIVGRSNGWAAPKAGKIGFRRAEARGIDSFDPIC